MLNKKNLLGKFINNLTYAFGAQAVSLISSALMSLLVAKFLGVVQFAYWQLFIFYSTYVGLFHFGLSDGVYLRCGGSDWSELDKTLLGSQLKIMNIFHSVIFLAICLFCGLIFEDKQRVWVWICAGLYLLIANTTYYLGFVFQAVNQTKVHSTATIISKAGFIISIIILVSLRMSDFRPYCILFLISHLAGTIYLIYNGKEIVFSVLKIQADVLREIWINIKVGINLTISSVASNLTLGIGRILVDLNDGLETFGIISLAVSLTSFILNFLSQVSMVMFPMLRKFRKEDLVEFYVQIRSLLSYLLSFTFVIFVPFRMILEIWLPQYGKSFEYMAILFPICIFDGKMQMLYNTYFKVMRKEKNLLYINIFTLMVSAFLCVIAIWKLESVIAIAFAMLLSVFLRSLISSFILSRILKASFELNLVYECILSSAFILTNIFFDNLIVLLVSWSLVSIYFFVNFKKIKEMVKILKKYSK